MTTYSLHLREPQLEDRAVNARTFGAGAGWRLSPELELMAGAYENSHHRTSRYAVAAWWLGEHLAVAGGYLDGYERAPLGVALVARAGVVRLVLTPGGAASLWFAVEL